MQDTAALLEQCAPHASPLLMRAIVRAESSWQPLAIGMDAGSAPVSQPRTLADAITQVKALTASGRGFSVGLAQIHVSNVVRYGLSWEQAFDPCLNLRTGQEILRGFHRLALAAGLTGPAGVRAALRGYNAGSIGRRAGESYAQRVISYAAGGKSPVPTPGSEPAADALLTVSPRSRSASLGHPLAGPQAGTNGGTETPDIFTRPPQVPGF